MYPLTTKSRKRTLPVSGFSLVEMLVTMAIILILVSLLLPTVTKSIAKAKQIHCVSKLRQLGLGMNSYAHDHNGNYPMQIPTLRGGSMFETRYQLPASPYLSFSGRHFEVLSNEITSPRILVCPADKRESAPIFTRLSSNNISYWVFYRAALGNSMHPLAGDWNVRSVASSRSIVGNRTNLLTIRFDEKLHQFRGNILFADGHVELSRNMDMPDPGNLVGTSKSSQTASKLPPETAAPNSSSSPAATHSPSSSPVRRGNDPLLPSELSNSDHPFQTTTSGIPPLREITTAAADPPTPAVAAALQNDQLSSPRLPTTASLQPPTKSSLNTHSSSAAQYQSSNEQRGTHHGDSPDDESRLDPLVLRTMRQGIKFTFLLGIVLTLAGFAWHYLNRKRPPAPEPTPPESGPLPPDLLF